MVEPVTLPHIVSKPEAPISTLPAYRPGNWFCGCCGHSLMRLKWEHGDVVARRGHEDWHCLNAGCTSFQQAVRIPLDLHYFPKVFA